MSAFAVAVSLVSSTAIVSCAGDEPASELQLALTKELQPAKPYDCDSLDYGLYWYGKDNKSKKSTADGRNITDFYDSRKPTMIYVHGWQRDSVKSGLIAGTHKSNGREEFFWDGMNINVANAWIAKGWNVGLFQWTQLADDEGTLLGSDVFKIGAPLHAEAKIWAITAPASDMPGGNTMRWRRCDETFTNVGMPPKPAGQLYYEAYKAALSQYRGPEIRVAGHSLGNQMTAAMLERVFADPSIPASRRPQRVALLDPYWSPGPKSYLGGITNAQRVLGIVADLRGRGVVFEWSKTSGGEQPRG